MAIYYIIMLVIFAITAGFVYSFQYENSRKGLKKYFSRLNKLERFYNGQKKKDNCGGSDGSIIRI